MDASLWGTLNSSRHQRERKKYFENFSQRQNLIDSSEEENSEDEEWIQQLERDYGKRGFNKKKKWTNLEKTLTFSLFSALFLVVLLLTALLYSKHRHGESLFKFALGGKSLCSNEACITTSHRVITYQDNKVNPCDSFYDHACGQWLRTMDLSSTHTKMTSFTDVSDRNQRTLKRILDELAKRNTPTENEAVRKVRTFYKSCQRKEFIENYGNSSLVELINYIGGWALTNSSHWNEEDWSFGQALTRIHHLKSMPLFYMYVAADDKNSTENIIQIEQSGITLSEEDIYSKPNSDTVIQGYLKLMTDVGRLLGGSKDSVIKQATEILDFERNIAQIFVKREKRNMAEKAYNKMSVADLQKLCPAIPWLDYMNSMFSEPVRSGEKIIVYTPEYLKKMSDLVIKTERRIIANYMTWHLIKPILPFLSKPYRSAAVDFEAKISGMKGTEESWKNCVTKTDSVLGFATGHLFTKEMEKEGMYNEKKVKRMLQLIKDEFIINLHHVSWMDDETRKKAVDKANAIVDLIGFPLWIEDTKKLDQYYQNLNITDDPLRNYFNAREFYHSKTMERRGKSVHRNEWHMTPTEVNAYYNSPNNYIALPIGLLQAPFFHSEFPMSVNFGALGTIMGHELTHGFDTQGQYFNNRGDLQKWWTNITTERFKNVTGCLTEHYQSFQNKPELLQNLAEDIADNGGVKVAFNAFKTSEYVDGEDPALPGISLSSDQLFFMGYAQSWCSLSTNEKSKQDERIDKHNSARTRVDATLSNSMQFSRVYKCPVGSRMNPPVKCTIW